MDLLWLIGDRALLADRIRSCGDLLRSGDRPLLVKDFLGERVLSGVLFPLSETGDLRLSGGGDLTGECRVLSFNGDFLPRDSSFLTGLGVLPFLGDLSPPRFFLPGLLLRDFSRTKLELLLGKSFSTPGLK